MRLVPRENIIIGPRQRSKMDPTKKKNLKDSIYARGLLQPPVVQKRGESYDLVAGERRIAVIDEIAKESGIFTCDGSQVTPGEVPVLFLDEYLSQVEVFNSEFDENDCREDLLWPDRCKALAALHTMRKAENKDHLPIDTAREVLTKQGKQDLAPTNMLTNVREAIVVAEHLHDPKVAGARNASEAYTAILKQETERINSEIARRRLSSTSTKPLIEVRHADLRKTLPLLEDGLIDLICADPPYGIDASGGGFRSRTIHHHDYEDTVEAARELALAILAEGFRITKPRANLFLFTDIKHWEWLQTVSAQVGWTPFRRPLIWGKSDSEGLAPWGQQGPRITTEFIFFATKGQKGLLSSPIDYLRVNRVKRHERIHAAEKPVELMTKLIECSTLPDDLILDPCCGSGSTLVAARETRRRAIGFEKDEGFFHTAMSNVHQEKPDVKG